MGLFQRLLERMRDVAVAGETDRQGSLRQHRRGCDRGKPRVIVYLDASALAKRYLDERGSRDTIALTVESEMVATSIVSRAEVAAGWHELRVLASGSGVVRRAHSASSRGTGRTSFACWLRRHW